MCHLYSCKGYDMYNREQGKDVDHIYISSWSRENPSEIPMIILYCYLMVVVEK